jgi:hypothetical protein
MMPEQIAIWVVGICVILVAAALAAQGVAGFQILSAIRPLLRDSKQLTNEGEQLAAAAAELLKVTKPRVLSTAQEARDLARGVVEQARSWKAGAQNAVEPLLRFRQSFRVKAPKRSTQKRR